MSGYGHNTNAQCMDLVVTTRCWTHDHMQYVLPPLLMLPPYYLLAFHVKLTSQVRSLHCIYMAHMHSRVHVIAAEYIYYKFIRALGSCDKRSSYDLVIL